MFDYIELVDSPSDQADGFASVLLFAQGFTVTSPTTISRLLQQRGYRLRVNRKRLTREQDENRDRQIRYLTRQRRIFLRRGNPVLSVDTKKKELVGNLGNAGRT
jgi:hypothetical protein